MQITSKKIRVNGRDKKWYNVTTYIYETAILHCEYMIWVTDEEPKTIMYFINGECVCGINEEFDKIKQHFNLSLG